MTDDPRRTRRTGTNGPLREEPRTGTPSARLRRVERLGRRRHAVLIVDDDASVRDLFVDALEVSGHVVALARDGAEALDVLRAGPLPCVVLSDVRMPRMDGFELARAVARDPQLNAIPVVVLTGDRVLSFSSPARDKPFSVAELDALVQRSCAFHRETRERAVG